MFSFTQFSFIILVLQFTLVSCTDEATLLNNLLTGYDNKKYVRPSGSSNQPLTIKLGIGLNQIIELEEQKQVL